MILKLKFRHTFDEATGNSQATCVQLPRLTAHSPTRYGALRSIVEAVAESISNMSDEELETVDAFNEAVDFVQRHDSANDEDDPSYPLHHDLGFASGSDPELEPTRPLIIVK